MDALHLHIEQRLRIHRHAGVALDVVAQVLLHVELGALPALQEAAIACEALQLAQLVEVADPAGTHRLIQQGRKAWIGQGHPTAWRDAIGDIGELLGP